MFEINEPAGWIPPQYRVFIEEPLTDEEAKAIYGTCGISIDGVYRHYTIDEIKKKFKKTVGVVDSRSIP